jgi:D-lactate dehydrogenase
MRVALFSAKAYEKAAFNSANAAHGHDLLYFEAHLNADTAALGEGFPAVCIFVNDQADNAALKALAAGGTSLLALRSAGYNHVDLDVAESLGMAVVRVPAYSPYAVAEHSVALMLTLNRKTHRAHNRVREGNFELEGLLGFDMHGRTVGIIGTGRIGIEVARILRGFGCTLLGYDPYPNPEAAALSLQYVDLATLFARSDIISLHSPLTPQTHHLIGPDAIQQMKPGVMLINTSRGALVDTTAAIEGLKSGQIGYLGLDVYEEEADLFFEDLSGQIIQDDVFARLLTFPNVLITGHQAFFTREALTAIAATTLANVTSFAATGRAVHEIAVDRLA